MAIRVLLVEDDEAVVEVVRVSLPEGEYLVESAPTAAEGWRLFESSRPDLVILDLGLPDDSGLSLCRKVRAHASRGATPIIVLTGRADIEDKANLFAAGADHYLVKPIPMAELKLWVSALLRRVRYCEEAGGVLRAEGFSIDPQSHTVSLGEALVRNLTRKEFDLLYELVRVRPRPLSKNFILSSLWGEVLRDNTVEVHIRNIRGKLGAGAKRIVTVAGVGYRFE